MASDVGQSEFAAGKTLFHHVDRFITTQRIRISIVAFAAIVALDVLVIGVRPRDVLDGTDPLVICGHLLILLGLAIRSWAAGTIHKNKNLTMSGPYGIVRNPLYAGSFLLMLGFMVLIDSLISVVLVAVVVAILYWFKVRQEERYLASLHPQQWPDYRDRTPRFFPRRLVTPEAAEWSLSQWLHNREFDASLASFLALLALKAWHYWG